MLPYIYENLDIVDSQIKSHLARPGKDIWLRYTDIGAFKNQLQLQMKRHEENSSENTWPSWNATDRKMKRDISVKED